MKNTSNHANISIITSGEAIKSNYKSLKMQDVEYYEYINGEIIKVIRENYDKSIKVTQVIISKDDMNTIKEDIKKEIYNDIKQAIIEELATRK